jgi:tetratricopeptide (TPR) repeat protein
MPKLNHEIFRRRAEVPAWVKPALVAALLAVAVAAVWLNWDALTKTDAERYQEAYDAGRLDEALEVALRIAAEDPDSARAQLGVAAVYLQRALRGDVAAVAAARAAAARAAEIDPNDPDASRTLGYTYELEGDYDSAIEYYERAIAAAPRDALALTQLGSAYAATGRSDLAERQYELAIRADSYVPEPRLLLAQARLARGDDGYSAIEAILEPALGAQNVALAADARATVSRIRLAQGKGEAAEALAREAVETAPESFSALTALAEALYDGVFSRGLPWSETLKEVHSLAQRAATADPTRAMAPFLAFRATSAVGDKTAAATYADRTLRLLEGDRTLSDAQRDEIRAQIEFVRGVKVKVKN